MTQDNLSAPGRARHGTGHSLITRGPAIGGRSLLRFLVVMALLNMVMPSTSIAQPAATDGLYELESNEEPTNEWHQRRIDKLMGRQSTPPKVISQRLIHKGIVYAPGVQLMGKILGQTIEGYDGKWIAENNLTEGTYTNGGISIVVRPSQNDIMQYCVDTLRTNMPSVISEAYRSFFFFDERLCIVHNDRTLTITGTSSNLVHRDDVESRRRIGAFCDPEFDMSVFTALDSRLKNFCLQQYIGQPSTPDRWVGKIKTK